MTKKKNSDVENLVQAYTQWKKREPRLANYLAERDAMLLKCDVDAMEAFQRKHKLTVASSREISEIVLHKTRTAAMCLPREERLKSWHWLTERGYTPWSEDLP
jgi:hypothetical protein